jgi:hypothetical protein
MSGHLFQGSIFIKVKGCHKKFSWCHEFSPEELSFHQTLIPLFLKDVNIPEHERVYLTKDVRKLLLQVRNIKPMNYLSTIQEIKTFIASNKDKEIQFEAHGIGVYILSWALKNTRGHFQFNFYEFPYALLDKSFQKRLLLNSKTKFFYSKETPFASIKTLLGPQFRWRKLGKNLVA